MVLNWLKRCRAVSSFTLSLLIFVSGMASAQTTNQLNPRGNTGVFVVEPPDSSIQLDNPADLLQLKRLNITGIFINENTHEDFKGANFSVFQTTPFTDSKRVRRYLPQGFIGMPVGQCYAVGFMVANLSSPGVYNLNNLETPLRYNFRKLEVTITDIAPVVAVRFNRCFSFGAALDYYSVIGNLTAILPGSIDLNPAFDSILFDQGGGYAWGWHASFAIDLPQKTHIVVAYRNRFKVDSRGVAKFVLPVIAGGAEFINSQSNVQLKEPASLILRISQPINDCFVAFAEFEHHFDCFEDRSHLKGIPIPPNGDLINIILPLEERNASDGLLGFIYAVMPNWNVASSIEYFESTSPIIGQHGWIFTLASSYYFLDRFKIAATYDHVFNTCSIFNPLGAPTGLVNISGRSDVKTHNFTLKLSVDI